MNDKQKQYSYCLSAILLLLIAADSFGMEGGLNLTIADRIADGQPLKITDVKPDSPEDRAGIKPQSFLIAIDATNVVNKSRTQILSMLRGQTYTFVTLDVADAHRTETNQFTIQRSRSVSPGTQAILDQHNAAEKKKWQDDAKKRQKQLDSVIRQEICYDSPIPSGWVKVNVIFGASKCPTPRPSFNNVYVIQQYDHLPVDSFLNVCADAPIPTGWVLDHRETNYSCGCADSRENNIKVIKRLN